MLLAGRGGMRTELLIAVVLLPLIVFGCDEATVELQLAAYDGTTIVPIEEGSSLHIVQGAQGGTWIMPALQLRGLGSPCRLALSLDTPDEEIGALELEALYLQPLPDSWFRADPYLPVGDPLDPSSVEHLFGQPATLAVSLEDADGRGISASVGVVLAGW